MNGSSVGVTSERASRSRTDFFGVKAVPRIALVIESEQALDVERLVQWAGARRDMFADVDDRGVGEILRHVHWKGAISGLGLGMGAGQRGVTREPSKRRLESGGLQSDSSRRELAGAVCGGSGAVSWRPGEPRQ